MELAGRLIKDTALADGLAVTGNAIYTGTDKGNYGTESVSITITEANVITHILYGISGK